MVRKVNDSENLFLHACLQNNLLLHSSSSTDGVT